MSGSCRQAIDQGLLAVEVTDNILEGRMTLCASVICGIFPAPLSFLFMLWFDLLFKLSTAPKDHIILRRHCRPRPISKQHSITVCCAKLKCTIIVHVCKDNAYCWLDCIFILHPQETLNTVSTPRRLYVQEPCNINHNSK